MNKSQKQEVIDVIHYFYEIEDTQGTNAKKDVLRRLAGTSEFTDTLRWFFDSLQPTGIAARKLEKDCVPLGIELNSLEEFRDYITDNNTGRDVDIGTVQKFAEEFMPKVQEGLLRLAMKKWASGLGIDAKSANSVYGDDFCPQFSVMLCNKYWDDPDYWTNKEFGIQTKLDGFRTVIFKRRGKVTVFARSGKDLTGKFPTIEEDVKNMPFDNFVLDGERMPVGFKNLSSKEAYKLVSNAKKDNKKNADYCIAVYDFIPVKDWDNRHCNMTYSERYAAYQSMLTSKPGVQKYQHLYALELVYIGTDVKAIIENLDIARANDQEGVILKNMAGFYEWNRGNAACKVKVFEDIDLPVVGFQEGRGRHVGRLGALICDFEGNKVKVGSGFSDELRDEIWQNKKNWLGKTVEIVYFEKTQNKSGETSLRFPVYKSMKEIERNS